MSLTELECFVYIEEEKTELDPTGKAAYNEECQKTGKHHIIPTTLNSMFCNQVFVIFNIVD